MPTGNVVIKKPRQLPHSGRNYVLYNAAARKYYAGPTTIAGIPSFNVCDTEEEAIGFATMAETTNIREKYTAWKAKKVNVNVGPVN